MVYVDDTIFGRADSAILEEEIHQLGFSETEQHHTFHLRNGGEVGAFLGIQITKSGLCIFKMLQSNWTNSSC